MTGRLRCGTQSEHAVEDNQQSDQGCIVNGDTVIVKPGIYNEAVDIRRENVTLRAEPRRGATIRPPTGQGVLVDSLVGITVEGFIVEGGSTGISFIRSDNGTVRDNVVHSSLTNGINFRDSSNGVIEKNIVHTNGIGPLQDGIGIKYEGGDNAVVRNNLVYNNTSLGDLSGAERDLFGQCDREQHRGPKRQRGPVPGWRRSHPQQHHHEQWMQQG